MTNIKKNFRFHDCKSKIKCIKWKKNENYITKTVFEMN